MPQDKIDIKNSTALLVNELSVGDEILERLANTGPDETMRAPDWANRQVIEFKQLCTKARQAWALAVFSDARKESLERYFTFHLRVLTGLSKKLSELPSYLLPGCTCLPQETINSSMDTAVNALIDHLFHYFGEYPDKNILVPLSYQAHWVKILEPEVDLIKQSLGSGDLPTDLTSAVTGYLDHVINGHNSVPFTFKQLNYFHSFVKEIKARFSAPGNLAELFADKLVELEFNHFAVFTYFRDVVKGSIDGLPENERLSLLKEKADQMKLRQKDDDEQYDQRWPKLSVMLSKWLLTEITALNEAGTFGQITCFRNGYKLKLETSVAHLAFLLKLLTKDGLFGALQLTELFKFVCENFSTKRAETVSAGGLSKSYYSVTQVIAAEVKDMLLKMIKRINHDYFPVMAAIGVIIYAC